PLPLDETTAALFGDLPGRSAADATSILEFPGAAAILAQRWQQYYGETIDGVVAVDVITARHLVDAIGDLTFAGFTADADSIVPILTTEIYNTLPDATAQDAAFAE